MKSLTYRLGSMETGHGGNRRPLYCVETGEILARVESDSGPVLIGDMTAARARRLFPEAFEQED